MKRTQLYCVEKRLPIPSPAPYSPVSDSFQLGSTAASKNWRGMRGRVRADHFQAAPGPKMWGCTRKIRGHAKLLSQG